jgi:acylphosphatase
MSDTIAARFHVAGRVQNVAFRAYTLERALALGLRGYARNLADRRVEVLACGAPAAEKALEEWLHEGSPLAHVDRVERAEVAPEACADYRSFTIAAGP